VRVLHRFLAVLAVHERGDQIHGARAVQRVQGNQVLQAAGLGLLEHALHAPAFKLEHGLGQPVLKKLVGLAIIERHGLEGEVLLALVALDDELARNLQDGERGQAQKVELHQADGLHVVLVVLAHSRFATRLLVERAKIGELARRNQHAPGVHADVARHAFELLRHLDDGLDVFFLAHALVEHGLQLQRVVVLVALLLHFGRVLQGVRHARFARHQLGDAVAEGVAHVHHPAHVTDGRLGGHGAEGGDLAHCVLAVLLLHIVDHAVAVALAEVDVEVGHRDPLGVQEAFEQQVVLKRIQVGDLERIGHE